MANDRIDSIIDIASVEAEVIKVEKRLADLATVIKTMPKAKIKLENSSNFKELAASNKQFATVTDQLKIKKLELTNAIKEQQLAEKQLALQRKQAIADAKAAADADKEAARQAQIAGAEKIKALQAQAKAEEELAAAQKNRADSDIGTYDIPQGSGQAGGAKLIKTSAATSFAPSSVQESNLLYSIQLEDALKKNKIAQDELQQSYKTGDITLAERNEKLVALKLSQSEVTKQLQLTNAEIKAQTSLTLSAQGTIDAAKAQNAVLTQQRNSVPVGEGATADDLARLKAINAEIDKNNELIDKNSHLLSRQKINIGNYPTALGETFKTLNTELEQVQGKLVTGNFGEQETNQLIAKQTVLQNALSLTGKTYKSSAAEATAYKEAALQIGAVYGKDSTIFKQFAEGVKQGAANTAALTSEVVGAATKSKGFLGFLQTAYSGIRKLAYAIPGLGFAGVVLLLLDPLKALAASFVDLFKTINIGKITVQALNEVNLKAVDVYNKEKAQVDELSSIVSDNSLALGTRKKALEELLALNPDYLRGLTLENINTDEGRKILDQYNTALERKAQLQAAQSVHTDAEKVVADLNAEKQALIDLSKQGKVYYDDLSETQQKYLKNNSVAGQFKFTASLVNASLDKSDIKSILGNIDDAIKEATIKTNASLNIYKSKFKENLESGDESVKGIIESLQEKIAALQKIQPTLLTPDAITKNVAEIKKYQDEIDKLLGKTKQEKADKLQGLQDSLNTEFEIYKVAQQRKIQEFNKEVNSDNVYYLDKLTALEKYTKASEELIKKQEENDIAAQKREAARKIQNLNESKKGASDDQTTRINENIQITESNLQQSINLIRAKGADQSIQLAENSADKRQQIIDAELKSEQDNYEEYYKNLADQESKDDRRIQEGFQKAEKMEEESIQKRIDLQKRLRDAKIDFELSVEDALYQIGEGAFERQKNQNEDAIALIDTKTQKELDGIESSSLSEQEKAKKSAAIQKQSDFEKDQLQKKQQQRDLQQAKFERAQQIFEIGVQTIKAVTNIKFEAAELAAKAVANPFLIPLIPLVLAEIPYAIGAGIAAAAAILATPLPKFKKGTQSAPKGFAIVSEEGPELLLNKQGQAFLTPSQPSLIALAGGEKIFSHDRTKDILSHMNLLDIIQKAQSKSQPVKIENNNYNEKIYRELRKLNDKPTHTTYVTEKMETSDYYLRNIKW